jgi:outer membrane protein OmpA-like peptidoglycan-associated protein
MQVRFRSGSSVMTRDDEDLLKAMAAKVAATDSRLQLKAYAEATGNDTSKARRLSLSRALAVRSFLIENGLRSTRIDVRALGIARDGGAPDRVDIVTLER